MTCLGEFHSQSPGKLNLFPVRKGYFAENGVVHRMEMAPPPVPCMLAMQQRSVEILIMSFIFSSRASQKALDFFSPCWKKKKKQTTQTETLIIRSFVCFFKKNRNKKGFGRATLSKVVLLWGFHLLDFFFF